MKLVIDIDDEEYNRFKKAEIKGYDSTQISISAIMNGVPLKDIITEIERKANSGQWCDAYGAGMIKTLYIFNKHIGERSED